MTDEINKTGAAMASESLTPPDAELAEFEAAYGEKLSDALDLSTWTLGEDLAATLDRLEQEVAEALEREDETRKEVRRIVFPRLRNAPDAPANAGLYQAQRQHLEKIHAGLLFNGGVEACDGTSVAHDTLPLTVTQIGVCLVSYKQALARPGLRHAVAAAPAGRSAGIDQQLRPAQDRRLERHQPVETLDRRGGRRIVAAIAQPRSGTGDHLSREFGAPAARRD